MDTASSTTCSQEQLMQIQQDLKREYVLTTKGQELTVDEAKELEQIHARGKAISEAISNTKREKLELPWIHLPPLPTPSPMYRGLAPPTPPYEEDFFAWCLEGNTDAVRRHMEAQKGNMDDDSLPRGLYCAAVRGHVDIVRYMLQQGVELHTSAVESACRRRDLALFEVFVEHGWHPNQQVASPQGDYGVVLPYCTDNLKITEFLLAHGADPNLGPFDIRKRSGLGSTPPMDRESGMALTYAATYGNVEVIDLLIRHGAKLEWATPLHGAISAYGAWHRVRPAAEHVLRLGADPNKLIGFSYGNLWEMGTPLIWALRIHNWDAIELLAEWGADPDANASLNAEREGIWPPKQPPPIYAGEQPTTLEDLFERIKQKKRGSG